MIGSFRLGGLIGNVNSTNATVKNCAAWNSEVTASSHGQANWSSGAVIGTAHPNCHAINNFRNPDMSLTVYCPPPTSDWNHPDIDGTTHPLYQNSQTAPFTIMVNKRVQNAELGCNIKNDKMISVRFQGKPFNITVIQVYAPTSNA